MRGLGSRIAGKNVDLTGQRVRGTLTGGWAGMADAGRSATKVRATARKTATRPKSSGGTSRPTKSSAKTSGTRTSAAKASRPKATSTRTAKGTRARTSGARAAKKPTSAKAGATTTMQRPAARPSAARANGNGVNVPVPVLTPHMKTLHVPTPGMGYVEDAGRVVAGYLPPPERLAFYGGLGIAAVAGLIDWPVAAAIGVGTMIARRTMRGGARTRSGRP
jgi:hypothetical protein